MKNLKIGLTVFTLLLLAGMAIVPGVMAAQTAHNTFTVPIKQNVPGGGKFVGTLTVQKFANNGNQIIAKSLINGTATDKNGKTAPVNQLIDVPVTITQKTCQVLHLDLGPIHLSVLGLNIDISRIVIDITADAAGGILGNLLCSLAGATDINTIVSLLNQILAKLSGV